MKKCSQKVFYIFSIPKTNALFFFVVFSLDQCLNFRDLEENCIFSFAVLSIVFLLYTMWV